ncbi:MAG: DUF4340 domain-containing protein [Ruminococcaceae bacterium]|nr:DUF4340 domain-containing protein [Oscillospiraceae bacterium]
MKRKLIIYILILAALIAIYIAVTKLPGNTEKEEIQRVYLLNGFEINSLEVENRYGKYSLKYDYPDWIMDGAAVKGEYISRLSHINSNLKIDSDKLGDFGLENPVSKVTLMSKDGDVKTLLIGDMISDKTGRYVMTDGIYVVSTDYTEWLTEDKTIFKNRDLYTAASPEKIEFNGICFEITDGVWQMTSPYNHSVRGAEFNREVLENLCFTVAEFTDKSPEECGIDTKKRYLSVWDLKGGKTTIYFGDKKDGLIYAMREDEKEVCLIKAPEFLFKKPVSFLNTLCYVKNIDEIDNIFVNDIFFDISDGVYKKNGKIIDKKAFIEFYKKLMGMTLIDEAVNPARDKLLVIMKVRFKNGQSDIVEVYEYKERYGAVFINGECTFYTLRESAEEIVNGARKL